MELLGQIIGGFGAACLILSFQFKKEQNIFLLQTASGLFFVVHYLLLGEYAGMCMDAVCFIRALLLATKKKWAFSKLTLCGIIAAVVVLSVFTYKNLFSLFPAAALIVSSVALWTNNGDKIRKTQLFATSPLWMVYNISVLSYAGIICEAFDMLSVIVFCIRKKLSKKA